MTNETYKNDGLSLINDGGIESAVSLISNNGVNVETDQEMLDMDSLALSNPTKYLATYNNPKDWILDEQEAKTAQLLRAGMEPEQSSEMGSLVYSAGELLRKTENVVRNFGGFALGVDAFFAPNADKEKAWRAYKDFQKYANQQEQNRAEYVSGRGVDPDVYGIGTNIMEVARDIVLTGGISALAKRGTTRAAYKRAAQFAAPEVAERFAIQKGRRAATRAATGTIAGETFVREVGDRATEQVSKYIDATGDYDLRYYDPTMDFALNTGVSAINSLVEASLGIERIVPDMLFGRRGVGAVATEALKSYIGERGEEFIQGITDRVGDIVSGYEKDLDLAQIWADSAPAGIIGAVFGTAASSGMYYLNRRRMIRQLENTGMSKQVATQVTDKFLRDGINNTLDNLSSAIELKTQEGQAWDKLVGGVETAMSTVDFGDEQSRKAQATAWAKTNANIAMKMAFSSGITIDEFLDVAEFQTMNNGQNLNMVFLKPLGSVQDIDKRIEAQDAIITRQKELKKTGAADNDALNLARQRKAILQKAKAIKQYNDAQYKEQIKAQTTPETAQEIETATKDVETVKGTTQAEFDSKVDTENLTSAEKSKRYGNAVLKSILPTKTDFDAVMVDPMYANAKQAIIAVADRINSFIKAHRTYGLKTDIANALKKMQTVNQGNFIDSVTTPDLDGVDVIAENAFLYHFLFSDATTIQTYLDSYITRAEDSLNQKKGKLSKKDLVGQSFKATDNAMQTQAQVIGAEYTSIYNEDGSYADKNVMAVMLSYQNQFVQEQPTTQTAEYSLPFFDGEITTYYKNGNIKPKVLEKIYSLFTEEELNHIPKYYSQTLREILNNSFGKEYMNLALKSSASAEMINDAARRAEITPLQMYNAIRISRGLESVQEQPKVQPIEYSDSEVLGIFAKAKNNGDITLDNWENVRWSSLLSAGDTYQKGKRNKPATEADKAKFARKMLDKYLPNWNKPTQQLLEQFDLADENARLDDIYPEYTGETIRIIDPAELKQAQYEVIQRTNPMQDEYHLGIRSVNDIKTFDETIDDKDSFVWGDYSQEDAKRDLAKNEITIYSSKPIENGVFVSTSYRQAQEYAGGRGAKVYKKTVPLDYVAWINGDEGQFAITDVVGKKRTVYNSNGDRIAKSKEALTNFWRWFGDSKVVDEQGRPQVVYHGTNAKFDTFNEQYIKQTRFGKGFYFAPNEVISEQYGKKQLSVYLIIKNPFEIQIGFNKNIPDTDKLKKDGFDGVIAKVSNEPIEYVAFEPNQIKSVDNRGTYSDETGNIYYQSDVNNPYQSFIDIHTQAGLVENAPEKFVGGKEEVYKKLGLSDTVDTAVIQSPIESVKIQKQHIDHLVDENEPNRRGFLNYAIATIERPNLIVKNGKKNDYLKFFWVKDTVKPHLQIVKVASDGTFYVTNFRPTKSQVNKIIKEGQIVYDLSNVQISSADTDIIPSETGKVKYLSQGRAANGFYDPEIGVIVLGRNMNEMTLPHEMQHYWLDKIFSIYKRAKSGELQVRDEWMTETKAMFDMLGIDENQTQLTQGQQEKFARMSEAYLTGIGVTGDMNATFKEYQQWVPEKYKSMMNLAYKDDNGKIVLPYLDQAAVDFFNKWYANYALPSLATSPERQEFINPEDENGEVLPVSIKEMNNRDKEFGNDAEEQVKTDQRLYNTLDENMPAEIKVEADGQKVVQASRSNFLKESEKQQRRWFERKSRDTEAQLAQDYIEKNPEHAKEVIFGDPELIPNDTGIDRATLINAYMALNNITPESEDWATLHTNIAINQSLAGTQLALSNNTSYRAYLDALREIENAREMKAATNYAGAKQGAVERFNRDIQRFVDEELPKVLATAPNTETRDIALKSLFERARTKFSGNTTGGVLNQMDIDFARGQKGMSVAFVRWAINQIKKDAGAKLNSKQQAQLLEESAKAQQASVDIDSREIGVSVAGAQGMRKWKVETDKIKGVSEKKFSLFGDYAARAMLASFNTLVVSNIPSTGMNTLVVRGLDSFILGKNEVSKEITDSEIKRIKAIYGATAMNLAQMDKLSSPSLLHGEKYSSSGQKWYDPFTILGKEDNWFRVPTFVDALARIATQDAKATGRNPNDVFLEYCRLSDQSDAAKLARKQAITVANMAVFTQDGGLARALNGIRDWINKGSRTLVGLDPEGFGLGNLLSPFLKTGANIAEMGIRGSLAPITSISALVQKWRSGKAIDPMKKLALAMDWTYFLLSSVMVSLLAALTSDDDEFYTEPYEMGKTYDPDKPYDSINIAGVWIDLDFFGPFAIPIRTGCRLVKQWKTDNLKAIYKGYGQGLKYAAMDTPLLQEIFNNQMSYASKKPEDWATGLVYNQVNKLVPSQVKPLSRAISRGTETQLDMGWSGKVIERKFHRNYGFDAQELTTQDLIDIFTTKITWQP